MTDETPLVEPGVFDFDADNNLVLPKSVTDEKVRRKKLSPSTMNSLVDKSACPARFAAEKVIPRKSDPFGVAEIGTAAHEVLEYLFALPGPERTKEAAREIMHSHMDKNLAPLAESETEADKELGGSDVMRALREKWLGEVETAYKGIFDIEDVTEAEVLGRERWIGRGVKINGVPISGIIDRINTDLSPIDYKSGKVKKPSRYGDPHGDQLRLYALALEQEFKEMPSEAKVYYIKHSKVLSVDLSEKKLEDVEDKVAQAWDTLSWSCDESTFETVESPLCGWCPLVKICPTAKAGARTAQVEAPSPVQLGMTIPVREPSLSEGEKKPTKEAKAVAKKNTWDEDKPWVETIGTGKNKRINPNAYAATAVFGLATRALSDINRYNKSVAGEPVDPFPVNRTSVESLARTYAVVITDVQEELSGEVDWSAGLNTRLRSALFTATELHVPPFGGSLDDWDSWVERVKKNMHLLMEIGEGIYDEPDEDDPWIELAVEDAVESVEEADD